MLHQVGVSFDLYYDARKHKIKTFNKLIAVTHHTLLKETHSAKKQIYSVLMWLIAQKIFMAGNSMTILLGRSVAAQAWIHS